MSHYITAEIGREELELSGGSSHRTIRAVRESGFSIYGLYKAYEFHNGMSGSGEVKKVNFQIAEQAYMHAIAWALSLQESFPEQFSQELEEILQFDKQFSEYVFNEIFSEPEINSLIKEKRVYHSELSEDSVKRSFYLLYGILNFSYKVYKYTSKGNEADIFFG